MAAAQQSTESSSSSSSSTVAVMFLTIIIMIITTSAVSSSSCPDGQKAAILEYYNSILGGNLSMLETATTWNASASCCEWPGVSCYRDAEPTDVVTSFSFTTFPFLGFNPTSAVSSDVLAPLFRLTTLEILDLHQQNIWGKIPPGIGNLTRLKSLSMSGNHFSGLIPPDLFGLTRLESLDFGVTEEDKGSRWADGPVMRQKYRNGNSLEGKIPEEIGNLTNLKYVDLSMNKLTGKIPGSLVQLNKLESLDLQGNFLSGEIPGEIGHMGRSLSSLSLSDNRLTGNIPFSIRNMTQLSLLGVENNLLSGEIPTWLFDLPSLSSLYPGKNNLTLSYAGEMVPKAPFAELSLISCNISDAIPKWLANYSFLYYLDLSSNRITGSFPKWLAKLDILDLVLADNLLQGPLPPELFTRFRDGPGGGILDLSKNNFGGKLPEADTNKCVTKSWYYAILLSHNNFSGPLPACIASMDSLRLLDVSRNQLSGKAFEALCHDEYSCPNYIDLSFNNFHGNVSISSAEVLELSNNNFSSINSLSDPSVVRLKVLDLHDNHIYGEIPPQLAQISSLQILDLKNNLLRGSIPETMFNNLTKLQILDLSSNELTGKMPDSLGNLTGMIVPPRDSSIRTLIFESSYFNFFDREMLTSFTPLLEVFWKTLHLGLPNEHLGLYTFLDLSNNRLSGEIPASLGNLKSLKVLNISHNQLTGRIPPSIGGIQDLESLDLSHNRLYGELPGSMGELLQLTDLQLSDNNLTGRIPNGAQLDRMNSLSSYANNDGGLCGMQIHKPCDEPAAATPEAVAPEGDGSADGEVYWFSWMTAAIGYPAGLVTTVLGMYGFGYFHAPPLRRPEMRRPRLH